MSRTLMIALVSVLAVAAAWTPQADGAIASPVLVVDSALFAGASEAEVVDAATRDAEARAGLACVSNGFATYEVLTAVEVTGPGPERADATVSLEVRCTR